MNYPNFTDAILILLALWAVIGVIRDYRGTKDAASTTYQATKRHLTPADDGSGNVRAGSVVGELVVGGAAVAAGFGAALGWAAGQDAIRKVRARRAARRGAPDDGSGAAPSTGDPDDDASGGQAIPDPVSPASATGPDPDDTSTGPGTSAGSDDQTWQARRSPFDWINYRSRRRQQQQRAAGGGTGGGQQTGAADDEEPVVTYRVEQVFDDAEPPAPVHIIPNQRPLMELPMSDLTPTGNRSITPSATLNHAKADLRASRDASAALSSAIGTQVSIAAARAQSARARAADVRALAEQAQAAATKARNDVAYAQANRLDAASLNALAALAQQFESLAVKCAAAAVLAEHLATAEENAATAFNEVAIAAASVSSAAANAHSTLAAHQDPHQQAVLATGNEGARKDYLVG